jgi:reactive chlorine resistance protein C
MAARYGSPRRKDLNEYISFRIVRHGAQSSSIRIDCQVAPTLWTCCRDRVDWCVKITHYEAVGIQPLIAHSPLLSWGYSIWSLDHFTMIIGATELIIVALLAVRPWFPRASALGSLGAICMFLTTLSFILTTPGWEPSLGGFPALSGGVGEFLIKDFVLLGAAIWTLADSLRAAYSLPADTRSSF